MSKKSKKESPVEVTAAAVLDGLNISGAFLTDESGQPLVTLAPTDVAPLRTSPEWEDYVLGKFIKGELVEEKFPTADGLRRVFQLVMGPIVGVEVELLQQPHVENLNRATVKCTIKYMDLNSGSTCFFSDIADCSSDNTRFPYANYPTATASTGAESRVLRKRLGIKRISAEENAAPQKDEVVASTSKMTKITAAQINTIKLRVEELGINGPKFVTLISGVEQQVEDMSYEDAQKAMRQMSLYLKGPISGGEAIPSTLYNDSK